ncbi:MULTISPECIES: hypothetical protein [Cyanophyceae]
MPRNVKRTIFVIRPILTPQNEAEDNTATVRYANDRKYLGRC